jgi:hypothetical protein
LRIGGRWSDDRHLVRLEAIYDSGDQWSFRSNNSEVGANCLSDFYIITRISQSSDLSQPGISRGSMKLVNGRGVGKAPAERMLASPGADKQDFQVFLVRLQW